jgi:hypothetical protein
MGEVVVNNTVTIISPGQLCLRRQKRMHGIPDFILPWLYSEINESFPGGAED